MPAIFGDHMVVQQELDLPVWGHADPGEKVVVSVAGQRAEATADKDGKWKARLGRLPAQVKPVTMTVTGKNKLVFEDVLIGDVWVASGQSNMGVSVNEAHNAAEAIPKANYPQIRLFNVAHKTAFSPEEDCKGTWRVCTPESVGNFSAVAYFFGRELYEQYKKPIGLVETAWGGTAAESWTSLEKLQSIPELSPYAERFVKAKTNVQAAMEKYRTETLPQWRKEMAAWKAGGDPSKRPAKQPAAPDDNPHVPVVLFNGMIAPIISFGIKGVIWYQGENNSGPRKKADEYVVLFPAMIADWRQRWGQGDFPFLFVQLAGFNRPGPDSSWCYLRNAQLKTLSVPKTGMAVTVDIGHKSIHPPDKLDVGRRLALAARHVAYGEDLVYSGPIFKSLRIEGGKAVLAFDHVGGGLVIGAAPPTSPDETQKAPDAQLNAFEIAGSDGVFRPAKAEIRDNTVVVWSDEVPKPAEVRYAWTGSPEPMANLYNKEGLPASPFHSARR